MVEIKSVVQHSPAALAGLKPGDEIEMINGLTLRDQLDFDFYKAQEKLKLKVRRKGRSKLVRLRREYGRDLGIFVQPMAVSRCCNNCIFCFIHQNPKGLRRSLYVKDEDFRYSFLMGNYISLSNMTEDDWFRVEEQRLNPLYISVHSTNAAVRGRLLGRRGDAPVLPRLQWLKSKNLAFHAQMVVVPGYNDGEEMEKSILQLLELLPALKSIAVVPVGLTEHRRGLAVLQPFKKRHALDCLKRVQRLMRQCRKKFGYNILFAADEIYLMAKQSIPFYKHYGDFSQLENGVGLLATFRHELRRSIPNLPAAPADWRVTILTGSSAYRFQRAELGLLKEKKGLVSEVIRCENTLYGKSVTVAGLLGGRDFLNGIAKSRFKGTVLLPPSSVNHEGVFLDNLTPAQLAQRAGRKIVIPRCFNDFFPNP